MSKNTYTDYVIADNERWFDGYVAAPKVVTIVLAILYGLVGIVMAIALENFLFIIIFWIGGAIDCVLTYVILKFVLSYQILHIYYLKKLTLQNDDLQSGQENMIKGISDIGNTSKAGQVNSYTATTSPDEDLPEI